MARKSLICIVAIVSIACSSIAFGQAPLPLHSIDGNSGVYLTSTAYMANTPPEEGWLGMPSFSVNGVFVGEKDLATFAVTENLFGRLELGFAHQRLGLGDFSDDVFMATSINIDNSVQLNQLNVRFLAIQEGDFDLEWMPAITFGGHFKWNEGGSDINKDLGGLLDMLGADDNSGCDMTVVASKTIGELHPTLFPRPVIVSVGLRNTEAVHSGFVGFAGNRRTVFEGSLIALLTDNLAFAAEYRQNPNLMDEFGDLVRKENDWWSVALAYVINENMSITGGYTDLGNILNHREDNCWLFQFKYEF
ncbi:MAG: DUF3034 family protein [Planctomycetes bacterium]|nr:DUF3034 family protein [Planctomycetota bacterium]